MKQCSRCKEFKDRSCFYANTTKKDGLQYHCKECNSKHSANHYRTSPERRAAVKEMREKIKHYNRELVRRFKRFKGCLLCKEKEPVALDLHHLDPQVKENNPSNLLGNSTEKVKAEIRKCIVLCANCHRKYHAGLISLPTSGAVS